MIFELDFEFAAASLAARSLIYQIYNKVRGGSDIYSICVHLLLTHERASMLIYDVKNNYRRGRSLRIISSFGALERETKTK